MSIDPKPTSITGIQYLSNVVRSGINYTMEQNDAAVLAIAAIVVTLCPDPLAVTPVLINASGGAVTVEGPILGGDVVVPQGTTATFSFSPVTNLWSVSGTSSGSGAQGQTAWFIDRNNSTGLASDSNSGTASAPLLTFAELVSRWGTTAPVINQNTTITYLGPGDTDNSDPVTLMPVCNNCTMTVQGTLTLVHSGTLVAVTPKHRATPQLLNADLGTPVAPLTAKLIKNTTTGKSSYAWIHAAVSADVAELSQPLSPTTLNTNPPTNTEVDTWAPGDTYEVFSMSAINAWNVGSLYEVTNFIGPGPNPGLQFYQMAIFDPTGPTNDDIYVGRYVAFNECLIERVINGTIAGTQDTLNLHLNSYFQGGLFRPAAAQSFFLGGIVSFAVCGDHSAWPNLNFDNDVLIHTVPFIPNNLSGAMFGAAYISASTQLALSGGLNFCLPFTLSEPPGSGVAALWGPGSVDVQGGNSTFAYQTPASGASGSLIFTGALTINAATTANTFNPATGTWAAPITISAAHLDAALGSPGFGGTAYQPQTGCTITNSNINSPANPGS